MAYGKEFFDTYVERRGTRSIKWDGCNAKFGVDESVEMLPMWIADMDFRAPEEVVRAVTERVEHDFPLCTQQDLQSGRSADRLCGDSQR